MERVVDDPGAVLILASCEKEVVKSSAVFEDADGLVEE